MEFKFLKPNVKKIVVLFFIIFTPNFLLIVSNFSPSLFILGWLGNVWGGVLMFPFFGSACSLGFFDCNPGASPDFLIIIPLFILLAEILLLYLLSCLIVNKVYTKKGAIIFVLFIILLSVIPNIGTSYIIMEKTTPQTSKMEDIFVAHLNKEYPYLKFQELTVQNNFFLPTMYKLSEDTVCRNNTTRYGLVLPDGSMMYSTRRNVFAAWDEVVIINDKIELRGVPYGVGPILIDPYSKKKFYFGRLEVSADEHTKEWKQGYNGDYFLFSKEKVGFIEGTECALAKEEDAIAKITISE
jgi:hypothetical protein